jgi:hypothetical protein
MFESVSETDAALPPTAVSHTCTRPWTHVYGEGSDAGGRKTEAKLSNHKDRMDTKISTRKKIVKKKRRGVVAVVTTKRYGLHLLAGATNNRSLSEANGKELLVAQHIGG